jgi:hypothetical protein
VPSDKNKERLLKGPMEKLQVTYKGKLIRITSDLNTNPKSQDSMKWYTSSPETK